MGSGIAQLSVMAGFDTCLLDVAPGAAARARERIEADLTARAERREIDVAAALARLRPARAAGELAGCDLVIEAVSEDIELKVEVLAALPESAVLATNTSSLSIAAIAGRLRHPERVVGMHFFNPPPRMRLVEVVSGPDTSAAALELAEATAIAMDRRPIRVRDSLGFVVNRCARPYYSESLQIMEEGIAEPAAIDRLCRIGGPFRMGPFELMDLIGLDVSLAVSRSFYSQSFGEPRWKPSPAQVRTVGSGRFGRKSGRGWHDYGGAPRPLAEDPPPGGGGDGRVISILGAGALAEGLRDRAAKHGFDPDSKPRDEAVLTFDLNGDGPRDGIPAAVSVGDRSLAAAGRSGDIGFAILGPVGEARVVELTHLPWSDPGVKAAAAEVAAAMGLATAWVGDGPGLVLTRIVAQLVNEACFALGEGIASRENIDAGLREGLNHPFGPLEWGSRIGWETVLATIDGLWHERHDPRYRAAPLLRRVALTGADPE
jgi:3-hydroxybutyryl-CoA dehydrogenase